MDKNEWIKHLNLHPHPEGGYYRELYRSKDFVNANDVETIEKRAAYTSIYYLIDSDTKSFCHKLKSDELWYFHLGSPVSIYMIDESGNWSLTPACAVRAA